MAPDAVLKTIAKLIAGDEPDDDPGAYDRTLLASCASRFRIS